MSHILFISHARGIHGAEAVMMRAAKACAAAGARVTLVVPSVVPDGGMENALSGVNGLKIMALPYRAAGVNALRNALVRIYILYALCRLAAFIKKEKIDVIYSSSSITILGAVLAKQTGVRHIWHWHEPVDKHFGWHPSMKNLYRRLAQRADTIVFISHTQQKEWEETLNLRLANARIVYNPIKPVEPVLSDKIMPHEEVKIGFIGHFEERKNIGLLIRSFERIHAQHANCSLWLCGATGEADRQYIQAMTSLRAPEVNILPQTSEVAQFYHRIDILVLPSWRETMPLVVLEAMQAGVCVLQTNRSGMSELLEGGKETLFFSPDRPEELEHLLMNCMDSDYRSRIAQAGQEKALYLVKNQQFDQQIQTLLCE